ncbi:BatA domain-containing protein [Aliikangiella sp. G2MR2-5]|uniref:BatA domain-containing protein n=1 Tax=Aliikangiella sp. G2MR2-5 TaxID=2788943 RepID=UPI0018ABC1A4|nr:BatA domain-containing protein [Aliikangiella sp. G2MR2-5]
MFEWFAGLNVTNLSGLFALGAISIPVIIHLINPGRGKLVWVGDLTIIKRLKETRIRQFRLEQWLLLFLRITIVSIAAIALSELFLSKSWTSNKKKLVILSPQWLELVSNAEFHSIKNSFSESEIFVLDSPVIPVDFEKTRAQIIEQISEDSKSLQSVSKILEFVQQKKVPAENIYLYLVNDFSAYENPAKLSYISKNITIVEEDENSVIQNRRILKGKKLSLLIYAGSKRKVDGQILYKALESLPAAYRANIDLTYIEQDSLGKYLSKEQFFDVVFELTGSKPELTHLVATRGFHFSDESGLKQEINETMGDAFQRAFIEGEMFLFRSFVAQNTSTKAPSSEFFQAIWKNIQGNELLVRFRCDDKQCFKFNSRFHPEWTNMVSRESFPFIINELIMRQLYTPVQSSYLPAIQHKVDNREQLSWQTGRDSLYAYLMLLLVVLWLFERIIAERSSSSINEMHRMDGSDRAGRA